MTLICVDVLTGVEHPKLDLILASRQSFDWPAESIPQFYLSHCFEMEKNLSLSTLQVLEFLDSVSFHFKLQDGQFSHPPTFVLVC